MENGWFTIRIIQPKQLNNHSIIQKLRSLGGWNRRIYTQKPIGFRALVLQGLGWRFFGAQHGIANGGHWFCRSLLWTCSQQLNLKPLRISVQNVFLQEKNGTQISKRFAIFSTDPEYLSLTMTFLRSVSLAFAVVRIRSWGAWVFGGEASLRGICVIEKIHEPALQKEFENQLCNPFPNHFDTPCSSFWCLRLLLLLVLLESLAPSWSFWFFIVLDVPWRIEWSRSEVMLNW